jgi:hypothetical protein
MCHSKAASFMTEKNAMSCLSLQRTPHGSQIITSGKSFFARIGTFSDSSMGSREESPTVRGLEHRSACLDFDFAPRLNHTDFESEMP